MVTLEDYSDDERDIVRRMRLEQALNLLMEHFECIQIIGLTQASDADKDSMNFDWWEMGRGNFYARIEMARRFVNKYGKTDPT